jgi:hypothetical protein
VRLPPNSPVQNITFGFGDSGVIGYIDLDGQYGNGSFTFSGPMTPSGERRALVVTWMATAVPDKPFASPHSAKAV